jgi:hypothetical protein
MLCSLLKINRHFERIRHLHLHGRKISQARNVSVLLHMSGSRDYQVICYSVVGWLMNWELFGSPGYGQSKYYSDICPYIFFFLLTLQPPWALASDFLFHDHFKEGRTPWTSDQPVARPLPKHRTTQTQNKHKHLPGFELTIPASERVHALDCSATVTGILQWVRPEICWEAYS